MLVNAAFTGDQVSASNVTNVEIVGINLVNSHDEKPLNTGALLPAMRVIRWAEVALRNAKAIP